MANFVLIHGAWHGAWCWREVSASLIRAGHRAHAVTLTGVSALTCCALASVFKITSWTWLPPLKPRK